MKTYNTVCTSLTKIKTISETRKRTLKAWFKNEKDLDLLTYFKKVNESDYLTGKITNWRADFDWLIKPSNRLKVMEGKYDNWNRNNVKNKKQTDVLLDMLEERGEKIL